MNLQLTFIGTTVQFQVADDATAAFEPVRRFFRHLLSEGTAEKPDYRIRVLPLSSVQGEPEGEPAVIRRSTAPEFTFDALLSRHGDRLVYRNDQTVLNVPVDAATDGDFEIAIGPDSAIQIIDFVRDLVIRTEETAGTVVLHASAVRRDGRVYAIAGPKGAGKTTTLLSVIGNGGWEYFSGDKLFCTPEADGSVTVRAWRDYPYVGVGTLREHPDLAARVEAVTGAGLDDLHDRHKVLLDPDVFEEWIGAEFDPAPHRLTGLLLPRVEPGEPLRVTPVTEPGARWSALNTLVDRSVDTTFFGWQHYLVPDYKEFYATLSAMRPLLADLTVLRLTGTLDVDLDAVLKEFA
ncbi:hypothetical protein OK074_4911 [Actinobacteria bacterium OK074]|nr:hypothetical protein OK074_4911 [Actinobacteria bacterium OK074]